MDDLELETELKALKPRRVSPRLAAVFDSAPASLPGSSPAKFLEWRRWTAWSCAAGLLVGVTSLSLRPPIMHPAPQSARSLIPATVENVVLDGAEVGMISLPNGSTARRFRIRSADIVSWHDPATNASVRWIVPREDVRIEPVHFY